MGDGYFDSRNIDAYFDWIEILGDDGSSNPSLNEMASVFEIPIRIGVSGDEVHQYDWMAVWFKLYYTKEVML